MELYKVSSHFFEVVVLRFFLFIFFFLLCFFFARWMEKKNRDFVIVLNSADSTCKNCSVLKCILLTNYYDGDLDKCIRKFLRKVTPSLDKLSRRYEQKTKIMRICTEIIANFTRFDSVWHFQTLSKCVKFSVISTNICLILVFFAHIYSKASPIML